MFDYKGQLELLITSYGLLGVLARVDLEEVDVLDIDLEEVDVLDILVNRGDIDLEDFFFQDLPIDSIDNEN
jgi:hypothetical protein